MDWQIALYNNVTYSIAVIILISTVISSPKRRYALAFSIILIFGLILTFLIDEPSWIMPANTVLLTLCFVKPSKRLKGFVVPIRRTFYFCLTVSTLTWCFIATLSALIMLITPNWLGTDGYNIFMGTALVIVAIAVKMLKDSMGWCRQINADGYAIVLELVVLVFFSFILPTYYPSINEEDTRQWGIFVLAFIVVLITVGLLVKRMNDLEHERCSLAMQMERQKSYAGQIQSQFERMVTLRHYYNKLYQSLSPLIRDYDLKGLQVYFEENITPIHQSQVAGVQISSIKNDLIRNFIDVTAGQITTIGNLTLDIDISGEIRFPDNLLMDIFEILSNLVDNALRAVEGQASGLLRIHLHEHYGQLSIQVANTLSNGIDIEQMYSENKSDSESGYGLKRVREIVYSHPNIEHLTFKSGIFEGKEILVQQIIIS